VSDHRKIAEAFIECACWSTWVCSEDEDGTLNQAAEAYKLAKGERFRLGLLACRWVRDHRELVEQATEHASLRSIGHDLWLTSQHHGAGFWDGAFPEALGDALTEASRDISSGACAWVEIDDQGEEVVMFEA
jgi:hypothetical protein